jgi:cytoskeletal protein RodZ
MKNTGQTRRTKESHKRKVVRATPVQIVRQTMLILIVVVVWSGLLVGYLYLTRTDEAPLSESPAPTEAGPITVAPTERPTETSMPAEATAVSFSADVLPILSERCERCHGGARAYRGIDLRSYDSVLAGSSSGPLVVPGSSATSTLVEVLVSGRMPQGGPRLSDTEIETITTWIDEGALDN